MFAWVVRGEKELCHPQDAVRGCRRHDCDEEAGVVREVCAESHQLLFDNMIASILNGRFQSMVESVLAQPCAEEKMHQGQRAHLYCYLQPRTGGFDL